jgi:hypothetical protein
MEKERKASYKKRVLIIFVINNMGEVLAWWEWKMGVKAEKNVGR